MKKILVSLFVLMSLTAGCTSSGGQQEKSDQTSQQSTDYSSVCAAFPKELLEIAIGQEIAKQEVSMLGENICSYYTTYSDTYEKTPYGNWRAGGPSIVVAYEESEEIIKARDTNEKWGNVYISDPSIGMTNYVVSRRNGEIWLVLLDLGNGFFLRFTTVDDAVLGEDLVKIATEFAKQIKG